MKQEVIKNLRLPPALWEDIRNYRFEAHILTEKETYLRLLTIGLKVAREVSPEPVE